MNERLHEMILEFAEIAEEYSYVEYAKKQTGYSRQYFYNQKFADLIVRECIDVVDVGGEFVSRPKMVERLKEHFGVGE